MGRKTSDCYPEAKSSVQSRCWSLVRGEQAIIPTKGAKYKDIRQAAVTFGLVLDIVGDGRQVGLSACGVDVAVELGALADQAEAAAEQVAEAAVFLGVGVGGRQVAAFEQSGDGLGVLAVAFGFAAVDGFHGPGVTEDEGDVLVAAGVGQPVPAVHALAGDEQAVTEGSDGLEEGTRSGGQVASEDDLTVAVEDDEEEGPGVQIDASVESGGGRWREGAHGEDLRLGCEELATCQLHHRKRKPS